MKPRVLIVDDEPDFLRLVEFNLSSQGFEVSGAANGLQALQKARCEAPHVIILDVMLPDLNGLAICEILQAQPSTRDTPVIILSALDAQTTRTRNSRINVARYFKKGELDLKALGECIQAVCDEQQQQTRSRPAWQD
jgi:DNA-binding response OmpR family regulator